MLLDCYVLFEVLRGCFCCILTAVQPISLSRSEFCLPSLWSSSYFEGAKSPKQKKAPASPQGREADLNEAGAALLMSPWLTRSSSTASWNWVLVGDLEGVASKSATKSSHDST